MHLPTVIYFYLLFTDRIDIANSSEYLPVIFFLVPGILLFPMIFHFAGTRARKAVITREVLKENNDIPFLDFFNVKIGAGYRATEININTPLINEIGNKLRYIIDNYGINQLMVSIVNYFRLNGIVDNNIIQSKIMELIGAAGTDVQQFAP
ncbi:MAG: hypothetical protein ACTSRK_11760 [Promethearchaeota archaeon]